MNKLVLLGLVIMLIGFTMMAAALVAIHRAEGEQIKLIPNCEPSRLGWGHGRLGDGCHTVEERK